MTKNLTVGINCRDKVIDINGTDIPKKDLDSLLSRLDCFLGEYVVNVNNTNAQSESLIDVYRGDINIKFLGNAGK